MLIKKIFRLAAVLCLFFFSAQIAQAQEQLKGQELVNWISARTWILVEFTDTKGRTGTYGAEYPLEDLMLKASDSRFDGCNTCYRNLKFDVENERLSRNNDLCTEIHCPDELVRDKISNEPAVKPAKKRPKPTAKKGGDDFVLHLPYFYNMHYQKEGEYLILSDRTGIYKLKTR